MTTATDYAPYSSGAVGPPSLTGPSKAFTAKLREETAGVRLSVSKFGVRKALSRQQVTEAAVPFGADAHYLSASKKLIDTHFPQYLEVTKRISQARTYWRTMTVYFPVEGIRLLRKSLIPTFNEQMHKLHGELRDHLNALEGFYLAMRTEAQTRLGSLFNPGDYPSSIRDTFGFSWDFPSVEPPDFLKELNPDLYRLEQEKIAARFDDAFKAAEQAMTEELQGLVTHLIDKLTPGADGKPKALRKSAVENVSEFIERFRSMSITDNAALVALVDQAEAVLGGVDPAELRKEAGLQANVREGMAGVKTLLDQFIETAPIRQFDFSDEEEVAADAAEGSEVL